MNTNQLYIHYTNLHNEEIKSLCDTIGYRYFINKKELYADIQVKILSALSEGKYNPEKVSFMAYTATMIINHAREIYRSRSRREMVNIDDLQSIGSTYESEKESYKNLTARITNYILNERTYLKTDTGFNIKKIVYQEFFLNDKCYQEIADQYNFPLGTVKTTVFKLKEIVNNRFGKEYKQVIY